MNLRVQGEEGSLGFEIVDLGVIPLTPIARVQIVQVASQLHHSNHTALPVQLQMHFVLLTVSDMERV